jgi:polygalacturonase
VTAFTAVASATASCTNIILDGITVPAGSTLDLSKLLNGTKVTFAGLTFWEYKAEDYNMIKVGGKNIEITAEPDAVLDGNGQSWWDGQGSNGGIDK